MSRATPRHWLEVVALAPVLALARILPVDMASALGGLIFGLIGPRLGASRRAARNLARAFPDWTPDHIRRVVRGIWRNLGRTAFEYPHLGAFMPYGSHRRVEVHGGEIVAGLARGDRPVVYFSGHLGNWEIMTMAVRWHPAIPDADSRVCLFYRALNNPVLDGIMVAQRRKWETPNAFPKGASGARRLIAFMRAKGIACMLVDQKMNDGIAVPFFGRPAMTAPAAAQMALRYGAVLVPVSNRRLGGARFEVRFHPPIETMGPDGAPLDATAIMRACNAFLEERIREAPEQWFWVHRRWPD